jgi:hypothetical protein
MISISTSTRGAKLDWDGEMYQARLATTSKDEVSYLAGSASIYCVNWDLFKPDQMVWGPKAVLDGRSAIDLRARPSFVP